MEEIGDIGWFNYNEAIKIRPYQLKEKRILNELYLFIIDRIIKIEDEKNENINIILSKNIK